MPIQGVTTIEVVRMPRLGILRKGGEKPSESKPGPDLKHFRFDAKGDDELSAAFERRFGSEPNYIRGYLPYKTTDENFQTWQEDHGASGLKHRCDGQFVWEWIDGLLVQTDKPCPKGCKKVGYLSLVIPDLIVESGRWGETTVLTHGIYDIVAIYQCLKDCEQKSGSLQGMPVVVFRKPQMVPVSYQSNGKQIKTRAEKWLIFIEPEREWVQNQMQQARSRALGVALESLALPVPQDDDVIDGTAETVNHETGEIQTIETPHGTAVHSPLLQAYNQALDAAEVAGFSFADTDLLPMDATDDELKAETKRLNNQTALWDRFLTLVSAATEVQCLHQFGADFDAESYRTAEYDVLMKLCKRIFAAVKKSVASVVEDKDLPAEDAKLDEWMKAWRTGERGIPF